jgi:acetyl esterase/lipase
MPSHRRIPFFDFRHIRRDIQATMHLVAGLMEEHGLARKKVILGGTSSGGHLAALLALDPGILKEDGIPGAGLAGLFLMGAAINFGGMWRSPPLWMLAGRRKGPLYRQANPMFHLTESFRLPTLVIHGTKDGLVEFESVQAFVLKLDSMKQASVVFVTLPGGIHTDAASWGFPGHPANKAFFKWLQEMERGRLDE